MVVDTMMDDRRLKCIVFSTETPTNACAQLRIIQPLDALSDFIEYTWVDEKTSLGITSIAEFVHEKDLILVQRFFPSRRTQTVLSALLASGKPIIYETDDLLTELDPEHLLYYKIKDDRLLMLAFISSCDGVTVSTKPLAQIYKQYNPNIYVLPNSLDLKLWKEKSVSKHSQLQRVDRSLRIGFSGTPTHSVDLIIVKPALEHIIRHYGDRVEIKFLGCCPPWAKEINAICEESVVPYPEYPSLLWQQAFDIGLAPLENNSLNECKSDIKWLEYSILGVAGIYSDIGPYKESVSQNETGLLVKNDPAKWFDAIKLLLDNEKVRNEISRRSYDRARERSTSSSKCHRIEIYKNTINRAQTEGKYSSTGSLWQLASKYEHELVKLRRELTRSNSELEWITNNPFIKAMRKLKRVVRSG